jgi:hypothetical protein
VASHSTTSRVSIEDTFTRLMRLGHAAMGHTLGSSLSQLRLMEESKQALNLVAKTGLPEQRTIARRLFDCPADYLQWESQHKQLLGRIATQPHRARQVATALSTTFSLVHAKSLFEYLRESRTRELRRRQLIAHFHGDNGYSKSLVAEHSNYLRSTASLICIKHVGQKILEHSAFGEPIDAYERSYAGYFRTYCQWTVPDKFDQDAEVLNALQQELKIGVLAARKRLIAMPLRPLAKSQAKS